jgi:hypothetical protein
MTKIMSIDVSGNFKEGRGTSGLAFMESGKVTHLYELSARNFDSPERYWEGHRTLIEKASPDYVVMEGFRLYGTKANEQINSEFETPQLIGIIKMVCYDLKIPLTIQFASEVKTRWSEDVLVAKGILEFKNGLYLWNGQRTNSHKRDSLKHILHFERYRLKGLKENEKEEAK